MTDQNTILDEKALAEGNIYRWRWADTVKDADCAPYRSYHCLSQMAVVRNGRLTDTFWHGSDNRVLDPADVILTLLGNIDDLVEIRSYDIPYYRPDDIVDMRHSNNSSGPIYRRKDAEKDAATMLEVIEHRLEQVKRDIEYGRRQIEQLTKDAEAVRAGKLGEVYL